MFGISIDKDKIKSYFAKWGKVVNQIFGEITLITDYEEVLEHVSLKNHRT